MQTGNGEFSFSYQSDVFDAAYPHVLVLEPNRLLGMSEIERENILAERLEQMQKIQDRRKLQEMIKQQKNGSADADAVAKAAKRADNALCLHGSV